MIVAISTGGWVGIAVGGLVLLWAVLTFNGVIRLGNKVREAFSGIDVQLKRRFNLVPNLVKVVKAYATHEQDTLKEVIAARSAAGDAQGLGDRQRTENGLSRSLDKLIALVEQYPDLKADKNFRKLHHDLVKIEDDLQYARRYYNGTVRDYNTKVQQFPANLLAGLLSMRSKDFFEIEDASERDAQQIVFEDEG